MISIEIEKRFPPTCEVAVKELERDLSIDRLPADYRAFLLSYNGGQPKNGEFSAPGWGVSVVQEFYGLNTGAAGADLVRNIEAIEDVLPSEIIPIGSDPGGHLICLDLSSSEFGRIYLFDIQGQTDQLIPLAPSFDSFTTALRPSGAFE